MFNLMLPIFCRRNVSQYGKVFCVCLFLRWVGRGYWLFRQERLFTAARLTEMKSQQQQGFSIDALREQIKQHQDKTNSTSSRRILVLGLIQSLEQLTENKAVIQSLQELCTLYQQGGSPNNNDKKYVKNAAPNNVNVGIVYQHAHDAIDGMTRLQSQLHHASCNRVDLVSETQLFDQSEQGTNYWKQRFPDMNRFERLAVLRSLQRQQIIMPPLVTSLSSSFYASNYNNTIYQLHEGDYNVIVNFDADILQFPPLAALSQAIETAASANRNQRDGGGGGAIVCANGYEQWTLPILNTFDVYYDTFASVEHETGKWLYAEYVQAWWRNILTFPQATLFFNIIDSTSHPSSSSSTFPSFGQLWPMQSCFGGMAVYDYDTWSNEMCDYDRHTIRLSVNSKKHNDDKSSNNQEERWTLSPNYTVDGTISGDACEHVVFQQCLLAASQQQQQPPGRTSHNSDNNKELMIGIQPNLFIGRQADTSLLTFVLKTILIVLTTSAMTVLAMVYRNRRQMPRQLKQRRSL